MIQAVVFDFDGLILDTETPEVASWQEVFSSFGATYPESYWTYTLGRGAEQVAERPADLLRAQGVAFDEEEVIELRTKILFEMLAKLEPLPGVEDRLKEAEQLRIPIALASSSKHEWVDSHLERIGLFSRFHHIVCADDVPRAKPFPDLYIEACRRCGVEPRFAVALEDSANGIASAKAARLKAVAIPNFISAHVDLSAADFTFASLSEFKLAELPVGRL